MFCFVCLRLVCTMLPVSLDCPFLIVALVFSSVYLHNIWVLIFRWIFTNWLNVLSDMGVQILRFCLAISFFLALLSCISFVFCIASYVQDALLYVLYRMECGWHLMHLRILQLLVESLGNEFIDLNWNIGIDKGDLKC